MFVETTVRALGAQKLKKQQIIVYTFYKVPGFVGDPQLFSLHRIGALQL